MEQVIHAEAADYRIRSRIERKYDVMTQNTDDELLFQIQKNEPETVLRLKGYSAAMRRMPPLPAGNRFPCMADMVRVDTAVLGMENAQRQYQQMALRAAIDYEEALKVPFVVASAQHEEILSEYGFGRILEYPAYRLNQELLNEELLLQARISGSQELTPSYVRIVALRRNGLMDLAHFANSVLCRNYGLFMIRSAVYYEKLLQELEAQGGGVYQIFEYGRLHGYLAVDGTGQVVEAVFDNELEMERYLSKEEKPTQAVMARITNLPQMLQHVASKGRVTIALRLTDSQCLQNSGVFLWFLDETGSRMERVLEEQQESLQPELDITIGELVSFIFGHDKLKDSLKFDSIYIANPVFINETNG